jgi:hypothetical protein
MMNALTFLIVLMSLIPIASGYFQSVTTAEPLTVTKKVISLENFLAYRGAVLTYAEKNPAFVGIVPDASLPSLPPGYQKMGPWVNKITAKKIVVYGSSDIGMIGASTLSNESSVDAANYLVGYAKSGNWVSTALGIISPAPNYVPEGAILAIIDK